MGMTMTQKILAAHCGEAAVTAGQLINAKLDIVLGNDITTPVAINEFEKAGFDSVFDRTRVNIVLDHFVPNKDIKSATQSKQCRQFADKYDILNFYDVGEMGVEHALLPEKGIVTAGDCIIGADSHTCTYGAVGAFSTGVGSTDMAAGMAKGMAWFKVPAAIKVELKGQLHKPVTGKDVILHLIGEIGVSGALYKSLEFVGDGVKSLTMEDRLCICNMAIEAGARCGLVACDDKTIEYMKGRPLAPEGELLDQAIEYWKTLHSDEGAKFSIEVNLQAEDVVPMVTWGTSPEMVAPITGCTPIPEDQKDLVKREGWERAYQYMDLKPGTPMTSIAPNNVFIGSCTNGRIEDIRAAAYVVRKLGKKVAPTVKQALVVPGSGLVREQAEDEGLDKIFIEAGFQWRRPGCSMCLAMNADRLEPGDRCASTSNRNFEGRQGNKSRTHLCSPAMAAAAAIEGHFVDVRKLF